MLPAIKVEISSIESIESVDEGLEQEWKPPIPFNPRQLDDPLQVVAIKLEPLSLEDAKVQEALGPSRFAEPWGISGAHLCHG